MTVLKRSGGVWRRDWPYSGLVAAEQPAILRAQVPRQIIESGQRNLTKILISVALSASVILKRYLMELCRRIEPSSSLPRHC
jgi:hypothetical protein